MTRSSRRCATAPARLARIAFKLRKKDVLTVSILDSGGREVRRLVTERPAPRQQQVAFFWNGRIAGKAAPEGDYRAQVRLELLEKTITLPNQIRVDTTPPKVTVTATRPLRISPDGDRRMDSVTVAYALDEPAQHGTARQRCAAGARAVCGAGRRLIWSGRVDGHPVPAGRYRLTVVATDLAGNESRPARAGTVRVRYIALAKDEVTVRPLGTVRVRVSTDAASYSWRFAGGRGESSARRLELPAPRKPGRYALFVAARGHGDRMTVIVRKPAKR